jgi:hypothetical protein
VIQPPKGECIAAFHHRDVEMNVTELVVAYDHVQAGMCADMGVLNH